MVILCILSGIPALVYPFDSRVQEMCEFFNIPTIKKSSRVHVYEEYLNVDFTEFNNNFPKKFDIFEKFLIDRGIVKSINQNNKFLYDSFYNFENLNHDNLIDFSKEFKKSKYKLYDKSVYYVRSFKNKFG